MKVVIEVDIPKGWEKPSAEDVKRLVDPDWISDWWHISDVADQARERLTEDECREVLRRVMHYKDCCIGINWDVISVHANDVLRERPDPPVYLFLCEDLKAEFPYGIEYSDFEDGCEIFDVEWFKTKQERNEEILRMQKDDTSQYILQTEAV